MLNDAETQEAARIQARLQAKLQALEANTDLTLRGRDRQRARAILDDRAAMRGLREQSDAREQEAFSRAYREAFGLDQTRSAEDRALRAELAAADIGPVEAQQRMASALAIGDTLQARALAQLAYKNRNSELGGDAWIGVMEMYGGSAPAADRVMTNVLAAGGTASKLDRFRDKVATEIQAPPDLQRGSLESIAADDDGPAAVSGAVFGS